MIHYYIQSEYSHDEHKRVIIFRSNVIHCIVYSKYFK